MGGGGGRRRDDHQARRRGDRPPGHHLRALPGVPRGRGHALHQPGLSRHHAERGLRGVPPHRGARDHQAARGPRAEGRSRPTRTPASPPIERPSARRSGSLRARGARSSALGGWATSRSRCSASSAPRRSSPSTARRRRWSSRGVGAAHHLVDASDGRPGGGGQGADRRRGRPRGDRLRRRGRRDRPVVRDAPQGRDLLGRRLRRPHRGARHRHDLLRDRRRRAAWSATTTSWPS